MKRNEWEIRQSRGRWDDIAVFQTLRVVGDPVVGGYVLDFSKRGVVGTPNTRGGFW